MNEQIYIGTDIKVQVSIEASGFSMEDDDWDVSLKSGGKVLKTYSKADCMMDSDGQFYALVRAEDLKSGDIDILFHALVPDEDWDDGLRNETDKQHLLKVLKI